MGLLARIFNRQGSIKTRNYLAYAIGEILLVVIGIMLAVQVNDWQELAKNENILREHYINIKLNLETDIIALDTVLKSSEAGIRSTQSLIKQIQTTEKVSDQTGMDIVVSLNSFKFYLTKTGIEGLNDSGLFGLVDADLKQDILKYYWQCDKIVNYETATRTFLNEQYEPHFYEHYPEAYHVKNPYSILKPYFKDDPRKLSFIDETKFLNDRKFEALIMDRHWLSLRLKQEYSKAIPLAKIIISKIDSIIKK
ncbi:hypothetical protein SanaruYs_31270 [Chryseotalea sanaruensis]|uniref:Uncharacterized protein n=1 Tax=Chryseotalea sanaruensis TaxID=2482724 RepID=A0A401UDB5_9BACT|nr:DUF6090 family protein [Chryseotalea sanaruensis]GCC52887.1 hypothetical protein SanaruYs_31270 [Chryseotalea sanaruensis]